MRDFDYKRFLAWLIDPERKPANTAFTAGIERDAAYAVEDSGILKAQGKLDALNEVIAPFIFHGKALKAMKRQDIATPISKKDSSYLCLGAFKQLMEEVDPDYFGLKGRKRS